MLALVPILIHLTPDKYNIAATEGQFPRRLTNEVVQCPCHQSRLRGLLGGSAADAQVVDKIVVAVQRYWRLLRWSVNKNELPIFCFCFQREKRNKREELILKLVAGLTQNYQRGAWNRCRGAPGDIYDVVPPDKHVAYFQRCDVRAPPRLGLPWLLCELASGSELSPRPPRTFSVTLMINSKHMYQH